MSDNSTTTMIQAYRNTAPNPPYFFTSHAQAPARNYFNSQAVELDIEREGEEIAIAIVDSSTGKRMNSADIFVNKKFIPPKFDEAFAIHDEDLYTRDFGENPFANSAFIAKAITRSFPMWRKLENKIKRSIELQWSQVLTIGTITLRDANGVAIYVLDFKAKATHFPTAGTAWGEVGEDKVGDLLSLFNVIRNDGKTHVVKCIFGESAWESWVQDEAAMARLNYRDANLGKITGLSEESSGGQYRGELHIGNTIVQIWTYDGMYEDPENPGTLLPYMPIEKVVALGANIRLDQVFGRIPRITKTSNRVSAFTRRIGSSGGRSDMQTNVWTDAEGETVFGSVGTRPLAIPTAIDKFGCLDTGLPASGE